VKRGGSWIDDASQGRCANRLYTVFQNPNLAIVTNVPSMAWFSFANIAVGSPSGRYHRSWLLP
jgi:hypothetical protein